MSLTFVTSERRVLPILTLSLLPWLAVVLFTAGSWAAFNFLAYAAIACAAGYCIVALVLPTPLSVQNFVLAPATGILVISGLTAFWVRLGLPLIWADALWFVLTAIGAIFLWKDRTPLSTQTIAYGGALVLLSVLICLVYLLPGARIDAVRRADGSFNWMYVDTQYNYSIAAAVKNGSPPKEPGTYAVDLLYHFGGYAPAAAISRFDRLDLGDAFARVTRGASLWALMLSCLGLGTLLSLRATGEKFGGMMAVAGLFFYGSLLAMFTDELNSSSYVQGAILFKIPEIKVGHDGGPFSHLVLGHSELHALIAITAIMGICLALRERQTPSWTVVFALALPAFALSMHSVASLYCLGIVAILLFWGRLTDLRSWVQILLMFVFFLLAYKIMGYGHAPDATRAVIGTKLTDQWGTIVNAFLIGLGFRILGFRWISKPFKDPVSVLVLATVVGLIAFFLFVHFKGGEEIYGVYFAQSVFSIFAFSQLKSGSWRGGERVHWTEDWLRLARNGAFVLGLCWLLIGLADRMRRGNAGIDFFRIKIACCFLFFAALAGCLALMKRSPRFAMAGSAFIMAALAIGFLAWIPPVANFGLQRMKMDVTLSPGEVQGLARLNQLAAPGDLVATNKHEIDSLATNRQRSYAYAALSDHRVLLEGVQYHTPSEQPWFQTLSADNDLLFTTNDADTMREIVNKWHLRWLVARPGTDIALPKPLPPWLVAEHNTGSLKIYRID